MDTLIFALNAVLPLVLLIAIGYVIKKLKIVGGDFFKQAYKLCFRIFLPVMLFLNVYNIDSISGIGWKTPLFAVCGVILAFFLGFLVVTLFVGEKNKKGAVWQCVFRSNFAIMGVSLAEMIYGSDGTKVAAVVSAVVIPAFNILAVIALSIFAGDGKKISFKKILIGICKNPLIHGVFAGIFALAVRALFVKLGISFRIKDNIPFIYKTLTYISNVTTPLALIVLGGQFEFKTLAADKKEIFIGTLMRLIVVPALALSIACGVFGLRGADVVALIAVFGTPVAVSSAIMAQEMNSDGELAGSLVVATTVGSVLSLTLFISILRALGMI